jgi:hypothetical protein
VWAGGLPWTTHRKLGFSDEALDVGDDLPDWSKGTGHPRSWKRSKPRWPQAAQAGISWQIDDFQAEKCPASTLNNHSRRDEWPRRDGLFGMGRRGKLSEKLTPVAGVHNDQIYNPLNWLALSDAGIGLALHQLRTAS